MMNFLKISLFLSCILPVSVYANSDCDLTGVYEIASSPRDGTVDVFKEEIANSINEQRYIDKTYLKLGVIEKSQIVDTFTINKDNNNIYVLNGNAQSISYPINKDVAAALVGLQVDLLGGTQNSVYQCGVELYKDKNIYLVKLNTKNIMNSEGKEDKYFPRLFLTKKTPDEIKKYQYFLAYSYSVLGVIGEIKFIPLEKLK
ncbi:hypothetical protein [Morganella psychrotolerans]|uniref:hypothetical protein n=1 Tax=Morganella psychrotolerans TaxID=368603 RepID=UPI0039B08CB6